MELNLVKLFASVGFKVDSAGLSEFRQELASIKKEMTGTAIAVGNARNVMKGMNSEWKTFKRLIDPDTLDTWRRKVVSSVQDMYRVQNQQAKNMFNASKFADDFVRNIGRLHAAIQGRAVEVRTYSDAIKELAISMGHLKANTQGIQRFRQVPRTAISGGGSQGTGGGGGRYPDNQYIGYWGRAEGFGKTPLAAMMRPMLPTGMGLFNAVSAGYGIKELVQTGREMMQLNVLLKTVSGSESVFNDNLAYTRELADYLGIDIQNLTESYAKFYLAGNKLFDREQLQQAFAGTQAYFRLLGLSPEKIKLANKAIEQMMNKQRVNSEELKGQLAEHATGAMQFFADAVAGGNVATLMKMMEQGKVDINAIVEAMKRMGKYASSSPDLQRMLDMSGAKQARFENAMKRFSQTMMESGLDELIGLLFDGLGKILILMGPFIRSLSFIIRGLLALGKAIKENLDVTAAFVGAVGLGGIIAAFVKLGPLGGGMITTFRALAVVFVSVAKAIWAAHGATIRLMGLFGTLLFLSQSVSDFWSGDKNWVYQATLWFDILASSFDITITKMLIRWEMFKDYLSDTTFIQLLKDAFGFGVDLAVKAIPDKAKDAYNRVVEAKPQLPMGDFKPPWMQPQQNVPNQVTVQVNLPSVPPSIANDPKATGQWIGQGISLGNLGGWGRN